MYKRIAQEFLNILRENDIALAFDVNDQAISTLASSIEERLGKPKLPNPNESVAIPGIGKEKTTALLFDRIWIAPTVNYNDRNNDGIPDDIWIFGSTEQEVRAAALLLAYKELKSDPVVPFAHYLGEKNFVFGDVDWFPRRIQNSLIRKHKIAPIPVYESRASYDRDYKPGVATDSFGLGNFGLPNRSSIELANVDIA